MSGDVLRRAARLMRLNAEEADDGFPWRAEGSYVDTDPECGFNAGTSLIADHVASWHPAVALAVADWLEAKAEQDDKGTCDDPRGCCNLCEHDYGHIAALEVARAYLGGDGE
jgi:hypothetical protein